MFSAARRLQPALVIDCDPFSRSTIQTALSSASFDVYAVDTREAARNCVRQRRVDLILADLFVEDEPGESLVRELLEMPAMEDVPVMFLAARQVPDVIRRTYGPSGAYHLRKPVDPTVLINLATITLAAPHPLGGRRTLGHELPAAPHGFPSVTSSTLTPTIPSPLPAWALPLKSAVAFASQ